jgi:hypothetical protein
VKCRALICGNDLLAQYYDSVVVAREKLLNQSHGILFEYPFRRRQDFICIMGLDHKIAQAAVVWLDDDWKANGFCEVASVPRGPALIGMQIQSKFIGKEGQFIRSVEARKSEKIAGVILVVGNGYGPGPIYVQVVRPKNVTIAVREYDPASKLKLGLQLDSNTGPVRNSRQQFWYEWVSHIFQSVG